LKFGGLVKNLCSLKEMNENYMRDLAKVVRGRILNMIYKTKSGHIASSFSIVEILLALYFGILRVNPSNPSDPDRDRFILSKGHGCAALYVVLAEKGFFSADKLETFCQIGSILGGHPERGKVPGIEASTGSLGHGLSIGAGIALGGKRDSMSYRTFVLMGDGECDEGSVWEAALFAAQHRLDNLTAIIDYNRFQASGRVDEIISLEPLVKKWAAFGWATFEVDGHDENALSQILENIPYQKGKPSAVIAHTVKGKGVSFIEHNQAWHTKIPNGEEFLGAKKELDEKCIC